MVENLEKQKEHVVEIERFPVLQALFEGGKAVEKEYEVERRYVPKRPMSADELAKLSFLTRQIEQVYVRAVHNNGEKETVRLRRTMPEKEGVLHRIAHKRRTENPAGRKEDQIYFPPEDARNQEFEELWDKHAWHTMSKIRYYIAHTIPRTRPDGVRDDIHCTIHYDVHTDKRLRGLARIEVEFKNDDDEGYVRDLHGYQHVLPDWVGSDVTGDLAYGSKSLARYGAPLGEDIDLDTADEDRERRFEEAKRSGRQRKPNTKEPGAERSHA